MALGRGLGRRARRGVDAGDSRTLVLLVVPIGAIIAYGVGRVSAESIALQVLPAGPPAALVAMGLTLSLGAGLVLVALLRLDRPGDPGLSSGRLAAATGCALVLASNAVWLLGRRGASEERQAAHFGAAYDQVQHLQQGIGAGIIALLLLAGVLAWTRRRGTVRRG